jgi:hypothetical protein
MSPAASHAPVAARVRFRVSARTPGVQVVLLGRGQGIDPRPRRFEGQPRDLLVDLGRDGMDTRGQAGPAVGQPDSRPPQGPATRPEPRKCHDSETDHGVIAVRQLGKARWRKIDMACAVRPYNCCRASFSAAPLRYRLMPPIVAIKAALVAGAGGPSYG